MAQKGTNINSQQQCIINTVETNNIDYIHQTVTLKCCIKSNELKKDTSNVRLISTTDWDKNLQSILSKIARKFKVVANMDDSKWILTINDKIIDKNNSVKFGQLLSTIAPVVVIKIEEERFVITIHYNDKTFDYKLKSNKQEWDDNNFLNLMQSIGKHFNIKSEFDIYQDLKGNNQEIVDIDDIDDIIEAINIACLENVGNEDDNKDNHVSKTLHLYVKQKQFAAIDENKMNDNDNNIETNEFKSIITQLQTENISIKKSMDVLSKSIVNMKHELSQLRVHSNDNVKEDDIIIVDKEKMIGECSKCKKNIKYIENELFNICLIHNKWQHIDCDYKEIVSNLNNIDIWSNIRYNVIQANERTAALEMSHIASGYHSIFGTITVKHDDIIRKWSVRIN
eukprot:489937_1